MRDVLTLILAGGKGTRLEPLTRDRAQPAVPFGGLYRIIDFTLSNCINSGLRRVLVLTQYKARSLDRHLRLGWSFLSPEMGEYVDILPPQQRIDEHWYKGTADAARPDSSHDFGNDVIPHMLKSHRVFAFRFRDLNRKAMPYWRDVGTLDAYFQANMDLVEIDPVLNLYDPDWPIRTFQPMLPPPKTVFAADGPPGQARRGEALDSMVCNGCIISGGHVRRSLLSTNVRINSYAIVEESILYDRVDIGRYSRIRRAIIDKDVRLPPHTTIGYDA